MIVKPLVVFVAMFALDFIWAKYTYAITSRAPHHAAMYASGIVLANSVVVLGYVKDPWMILPAVLGAYVGTVCAVRFQKEV